MVAIDPDRSRDSFETYSAIGATENEGLHRLALSEADEEVRDRFVEDLRALGLEVRIDELGNIFGRREGQDPEASPVLIGSHLDSQPYGGRYDGQLGVLVALETLRAFEEQGIATDRPIEIVDWTNEERSRFEQAMLGSAVFAGATSLDEALALVDENGTSLEEALEESGYDGSHPCEAHDVHSYLELHVEQGPELEREDHQVGVVDGVFGLVWIEAIVHGEANHSGAIAMHARQDALAAAAAATDRIHTLPNRLSEDAVATVGRLDVRPNSINVIPEEVAFTIDVRSYDAETIERGIDAVQAELRSACVREDTRYDFELLWSIDPIRFSSTVKDAVQSAAEATDVSFQHIVSGAGHDANHLTRVTDAGMMFVPSVDGTTHSEAEFTEWSDCVTAAGVYADATKRLAMR